MFSKKVLIVSFLASFLAFNTNASTCDSEFYFEKWEAIAKTREAAFNRFNQTFNEAMDAVGHTLQHHKIDTEALVLDHHKKKNAGKIPIDVKHVPEEQQTHVASLASCYVSLRDLLDSELAKCSAPLCLGELLYRHTRSISQAFEGTNFSITTKLSPRQTNDDILLDVTCQSSGDKTEFSLLNLWDSDTAPPSIPDPKTFDQSTAPINNLSCWVAWLEAQNSPPEELKDGCKPVSEKFQSIEKAIFDFHEAITNVDIAADLHTSFNSNPTATDNLASPDLKKNKKELFFDELIPATITAFEQASVCPEMGLVMKQGNIVFKDGLDPLALHQSIEGLKAEMIVLTSLKHLQTSGLEADIIRKQGKLANLSAQLWESKAALEYQNAFHKRHPKVTALKGLAALFNEAMRLEVTVRNRGHYGD